MKVKGDYQACGRESGEIMGIRKSNRQNEYDQSTVYACIEMP